MGKTRIVYWHITAPLPELEEIDKKSLVDSDAKESLPEIKNEYISIVYHSILALVLLGGAFFILISIPFKNKINLAIITPRTVRTPSKKFITKYLRAISLNFVISLYNFQRSSILLSFDIINVSLLPKLP